MRWPFRRHRRVRGRHRAGQRSTTTALTILPAAPTAVGTAHLATPTAGGAAVEENRRDTPGAPRFSSAEDRSAGWGEGAAATAPTPVVTQPTQPAVQLGYADGSVLVLDPGSAAFDRFRATADRLRAAVD